MRVRAETRVQVLIQHIRNDLPQVQSTAAAAREHEEVCSLISKSTSYCNVINKTTGIRYNMTSHKCTDLPQDQSTAAAVEFMYKQVYQLC